jgi:hypothetical protein
MASWKEYHLTVIARRMAVCSWRSAYAVACPLEEDSAVVAQAVKRMDSASVLLMWAVVTVVFAFVRSVLEMTGAAAALPVVAIALMCARLEQESCHQSYLVNRWCLPIRLTHWWQPRLLP